MGYVELLVILTVYALNRPMKIYEFLRGENVQELLDYILNRGDGSLSTNLRTLITKSYNYENAEDEVKSYLDLEVEDMIIGLKRLFIPLDLGYKRKSVFESYEIF